MGRGRGGARGGARRRGRRGCARRAARAALPGALRRGAVVRDRGAGAVEVTVRVPSVLGLPVLGRTSGRAHFRPQR